MASFKPADLGTVSVTEEQIDLLNVAEEFCREKSPIDKVRALMEDETGYDPAIWKEIGELGWLAIAIPEEYDGVGLSMTEIVPVAEQMGRNLLNSPFLATTLAAQALIAGGTEAQKSEILPKIAAGQAATLALSENNGDWDLHNIDAAASAKGDEFILSGTKTFVLDAASAGWIIASVKRGGKTALCVIDAASVPETALRREVIIDETKRSYELTLDGITVGEDAFLDPAKTAATLDHVHLCANLLAAAELTGSAAATVDYTVEYLKTRKQFGKLIGAFQAVKHPTVDAYVGYEQSRSLLYSAANSFGEQGKGEIATRMAKAKADQAASYASDRAIQFHGGFGFTYECDAQLYRRRAIFHASQYGDAGYHKKKLAALLLS